jgi:N-(2-amino-2-carboxyethyl)-L-glutamate synthase
MNNGILSAIGNTPLIKLSRSYNGSAFNLYAKLEALNPGGSIKDRPALNIIRQAMESGIVGTETVIIESSSGNMGIGLAQACNYFGLRFICVVDPKTTTQNVRLLKVYGAEICFVLEPDAVTGEFLPARIKRVQQLLDSIKNSFWIDQYSNEYNSQAHHQTMHEIATALDGKIDHLFCATSTCGTLRGCREYLREHDLKTHVWGVDAVGSVIFGGQKANRLLPGHGAAIQPQLYQDGLADACIHLTDLECVVGCRRLIRQEAILAGGSSGGVFMAVERVKHEIAPGANCVLIFPDRGERYLDTIYSDSWVKEHFGDVSSLWADCPETPRSQEPAYPRSKKEDGPALLESGEREESDQPPGSVARCWRSDASTVN